MIPKAYRITMRLLLATGLVLLLMVAAFYGWVVTGPRSVPSLNRYVEESLEKTLPGYHFHIAENTLQWDEAQNTLDVRVRDVSVTGADNKPVATLPEIKVNFTLAYLFLGRINLTDMVILSPEFHLTLPDKVKPESQDWYHTITEKLLALGKRSFGQALLQHINIQDANITLVTPQNPVPVHIQNIYTNVSHENNILHIKNRIYATIESKSLFFEVDLHFPDKDKVTVEAAFSKLSSDMVKNLFPGNDIIHNLNLTFNGSARIALLRDAMPVIEHFAFDNVTGSFSHPVYFTEPVNIKKLSLVGNIEPDFSKLNIEGMEAEFPSGATLHASGFIMQKDAKIRQVTLDANATKVPMDDIKLYWPSGIIGKPARDWVVERISGGTVPKAYAKLRVTEEDIAQRHLSEASLEASVDFTNGKVHYFDDYPPATQVNGVAKFTGKYMDIAITHGVILHSEIKKATVAINDFRQHPEVLTIDGEVTGNPSDLTGYFDVEKINKALATDLRKLDGTATTKVHLGIPLKRPVTLADMMLDITSVTENASLPKFLGKYDITGANLHLSFNGKALHINGDALANTAPVNLTSVTTLPVNGQIGFDGSYTIKGVLTAKAVEAWLTPDNPYFVGEAPFDLAIQVNGEKQHYSLNADLAKAGLTIPNLGWKKDVGEKMQLAITAEQAAGKRLKVSQLEASSPTARLSGSGEVAPDFSTLYALNLKTLQFGQNNLSLTYTRDAASKRWNIKGKSVDLSQARFGKLFTSSDEDKKKDLEAEVSFNKLIMKNGVVFTNAGGKLSCRAGLCHSGAFNAAVSDKDMLTMQLKPLPGGSSILSITSNRADVIARSLDIYNNMQGGRLNLDAEFQRVAAEKDLPAYNRISGTLRVKNFRATKTPILAKIATLASFEGINSLLENKGIKFKRLHAPFRFEQETIFLDDAKAYGESLGVTAKGRIFTNTETLNLSGTFVPSYAVNNILGKIPVVGVIGDALMGGKGEGILAVRYKVKGSYDNAEVTVNPLSILTPGFLRNLFDIVDLIAPPSPSDLGKIAPAAGEEKKAE